MDSSDESDTNRVGMGSYAMFHRHTCPQCFDSSFSHGPNDLCGDCLEANAKAAIPCIIFMHLLQTIKFPESLIDKLVQYMLPRDDALATFWKESGS